MICIGVASPYNEASSTWYLPGVNVRQIVLVHMVEDEERRWVGQGVTLVNSEYSHY